MRILVVNGPDGNLYYRGDRNFSKGKAADMAASIVLANVGGRWSEDDVAAVRKAVDGRMWDALQKVLRDCGAMTEADVRSE